MNFRVLKNTQFYLTSGQVPHLSFHNLSPYCIGFMLPSTIPVTPKKFCTIYQVNIIGHQILLSMIFEMKCIECLQLKDFVLIVFMCNDAFIVLLDYWQHQLPKVCL